MRFYRNRLVTVAFLILMMACKKQTLQVCTVHMERGFAVAEALEEAICSPKLPLKYLQNTGYYLVVHYSSNRKIGTNQPWVQYYKGESKVSVLIDKGAEGSDPNWEGFQRAFKAPRSVGNYEVQLFLKDEAVASANFEIINPTFPGKSDEELLKEAVAEDEAFMTAKLDTTRSLYNNGELLVTLAKFEKAKAWESDNLDIQYRYVRLLQDLNPNPLRSDIKKVLENIIAEGKPTDPNYFGAHDRLFRYFSDGHRLYESEKTKAKFKELAEALHSKMVDKFSSAKDKDTIDSLKTNAERLKSMN